MMSQTVPRELLGSVLKGRLTEDDALLWMVLLHTHAIHLRPILQSVNGVPGSGEVLPAETQRGAAEVIAELWPDRHDERADPSYWYWQFNVRTPYELLNEVPRELRARLLQLRDLLAQDPRVAAVVEED